MIRNPKTWRLSEGLTLAIVAAKVGIAGSNPSRTYGRYETGERDCPASVVEAVRKLSGGKIGAEAWHAVRVGWLDGRKRRAA
jgi:hypothetical protein